MDNDLISRSALKKTLLEKCFYPAIVNHVLKNAPAVDAVPVVRCKDCKNWKHFDHLGCTDFAKVCGLANYMVGATGYCVYGERRDDK